MAEPDDHTRWLLREKCCNIRGGPERCACARRSGRVQYDAKLSSNDSLIGRCFMAGPSIRAPAQLKPRTFFTSGMASDTARIARLLAIADPDHCSDVSLAQDVARGRGIFSAHLPVQLHVPLLVRGSRTRVSLVSAFPCLLTLLSSSLRRGRDLQPPPFSRMCRTFLSAPHERDVEPNSKRPRRRC